MRLFKTRLVLLLTMLATPLLAVEPPKPADPKAPAAVVDPDANLPKDSNFIVHEWGTFTSFSGSDGISLDFRPLVDEDLPAFVIDRPKQSFLCERREIAYTKGLTSKATVLSRQRMETPVTYFYTDQERIVDVQVDFPKGLLTEFYPPVRQFGPAYKKGQPEQLENSFLRWGKIRLLPASKAFNTAGVDPFIPKIEKGQGDHYGYARDTDSAHIQLTDPAMLSVYREKFLFYRGVGNFELPVALKAGGTDRFILTNRGERPLTWAFLINVDGDKVRYAFYPDIAAMQEMILPTQTTTSDKLLDHVQKALVSDGLYHKEAIAMVKTWDRSWFSEPGTRVLYSLPQVHTDTLLPLKITPTPKETVRVMVGRLEILTPEQEKKIENLIGKLGAADPAVREATAAEIRKLGRFAEPALVRVSGMSEDVEVKTRAKGLLKEILLAHGVK